ncbi:hypothetical protein CUJ84_Chr002247 [Rhizobium leguminosarum]|uniref:Uncharacterized protein n=1 Tax=Rhizobium leguminosarum TaxID=384 RepID=A0A2K9Z2Z7_RHILE|nr:hypothetical protein CUJ84_Chr002247 [Rhizobium leguminosarum]
MGRDRVSGRDHFQFCFTRPRITADRAFFSSTSWASAVQGSTLPRDGQKVSYELGPRAQDGQVEGGKRPRILTNPSAERCDEDQDGHPR